jgi:hypothetical protein
MDRTTEVRVPAGEWIFFLHSRVQTASGAHPASYLTGPQDAMSGAKQPECEVDHSPPRDTKVKNFWSYICICDRMGWRGLDRSGSG